MNSQEAVGRGGREEASAAVFFDEELMVLIGVETEQRELEAVLAGSLAVATTAVATELREDRDDLVFEVHRDLMLDSLDLNWGRGIQPAAGDLERGVAVLNWRDETRRIDVDDASRFNRVRHFAAVIANLSGRITAGDIDLLASITASQHDGLAVHRRLNFEGGQLAGIAQPLGLSWFREGRTEGRESF